jgi:hypothetical protein
MDDFSFMNDPAFMAWASQQYPGNDVSGQTVGGNWISSGPSRWQQVYDEYLSAQESGMLAVPQYNAASTTETPTSLSTQPAVATNTPTTSGTTTSTSLPSTLFTQATGDVGAGASIGGLLTGTNAMQGGATPGQSLVDWMGSKNPLSQSGQQQTWMGLPAYNVR